MKRLLPAMLLTMLILLLSGCKAWVTLWVPTPTSFPTPIIVQTVTPEPTPTFNPLLCIYVEDFRPLPDLSADLLDLYYLAGFRELEIGAEAYGQVCLDENKEARDFLPRQTNIRISSTIASLEDLNLVGNTLRDLLEVLFSIPQEELPGQDIGNLTITFYAGGSDLRFTFPIDLGRRAFDQGLTGEALLNVLR
jgi:hypothetical protein